MKPLKRIARKLGYTMLSLVFISFCIAQFAASTDKEHLKEALKYTRLELMLLDTRKYGISKVVLIDTPLTDAQIAELALTRPVCFVGETGRDMERIKSKFFSKHTDIPMIRTWADLNKQPIDGHSSIIMHRDVADMLHTKEVLVVRNKIGLTIWYDLKTPTDIFYLGVIGMNRETAKAGSLQSVSSSSRAFALTLDIDPELPAKERMELLQRKINE